MTRYVLAMSAGTAESLNAHAQRLSAFLGGRGAFAHTATLPGVAATLLNFRGDAPHRPAHRLSLTAATVAEAVEKLVVFTEHPGHPKLLAPQGLYANTVEWSAFDGDAPDGQDQKYLLELAESGRHDQLAKLWSVGFPVDWRHVYPDLATERPVYLPPTSLHRRRYWPDAAEATTAPPQIVAVEQVRPVSVEPAQTGPARLVAELTDLPAALRVRRLCGYLQDQIGDVLDYPAGERPRTDSGFFDLGMSSIHLVQVRQSIIADTAFEPSETSAFDHPTIAEFAAYLAGELVPDEPAPPAQSLDEAAIDRLSAHDLERVLTEVLT